MVRSGKNGDLHLKQIAYYKRTGEYHPTTLSSERSGIRRAAKKFVFRGELRVRISSYSSSPCVVEPSEVSSDSVIAEWLSVRWKIISK